MRKINSVSIRIILFLLTFLFIRSTVSAQLQERYVHEETFADDHNMAGLMSSFVEYFNTGDWEIHNAQLTLVYTSTQLIRPEVSDFTISLNGTRFYSQRISESNGEVQKVTFQIPAYLVKTGVNALTFESYIRTNEDDLCADDVSKASWINLLKDSSVSLSYTPVAEINSIADIYSQFTSIDALENKQSAVVLPPNPTQTELTTAGFVLSGLSRNALLDYDNIKLIISDNIESVQENKYIIYIAEESRSNPAFSQTVTPSEIADYRQGDALIQLSATGDNSYILSLTGAESTAMINAGRLLGNSPLVQQTITKYRLVHADDNVMTPDTGNKKQVGLTSTGVYLKGPFRQETTFYLKSQSNHLLSPESFIQLNFRYAENIDFTRSLVTVYVNNVPIGSKKLQKSSAKSDSIKLSIPVDLEATGNFAVKVAFDLEIADLLCTPRQEEMPWAYIDPSSSMDIETTQAPYLLFEYYPSPFVKDGQLNAVMTVLPKEPADADFEVFRRLFIALGRYLTDNRGTMEVQFSDQINDLEDKNIISIGRYEKNPIAQQLNNQLFFRFSPEGSTILSNEKLIIDANYGGILGNLELFYSPYSKKNNGLLLITGVQDQSLMNTAYYLSDDQGIWQMAGDGCLIDNETIGCYRFKEENEKSKSFKEIFSSQSNLLRFTLIAGGVLIILLIAVGFLWNRYIKSRRGNEKTEL